MGTLTQRGKFLHQRCAEGWVMNFMKKTILRVAAAVFGLAHASMVVAEGAQQLAAEQTARPLSAFFGLDNKICLLYTSPSPRD